MTRVEVEDFFVDRELHDFVESELLPEIGIPSGAFWAGLCGLLRDFTPVNRELLEIRAAFQNQLDDYHRANPGPVDPARYEEFLERIGYLLPESDLPMARSGQVDPEIAEVGGPQLVVPVTNARYAINAVNARWGSLYDALYGSNVIDAEDAGVRRGLVVEWTKRFLDQCIPLAEGSHADVLEYRVENGRLTAHSAQGVTELGDTSLFAGYRGEATHPSAVLFKHNGLHIELSIDRTQAVGAADPAGIRDVVLEAAVTVIVDFEDAVSIVDAADKVAGYRNWLGLNTGVIEAEYFKEGRKRTRRLDGDRAYTAPDGTGYELRGRALMFNRNVGLHLFSDMIVDSQGAPVPESLVDLAITAACALPGLRGATANSAHGCIYVVRPKMHGPAEVRFVDEAASHIERMLGLPGESIRLGVMDEERRTSLNLAAVLRAAGARLAFVNTGFLDRTGSEIRSAFHAGPFPMKAAIKSEHWYQAYEDSNVDVALELGLPRRAQIGKGMWTLTDDLGAMVEVKGDQLRAGATTGWVPSPTAATLHATHYHQVDVFDRHRELAHRSRRPRREMLISPGFLSPDTDRESVLRELDDNVQSILGYVLRWVDLGVGSSKVLDIDGIALMEDRATLRISSQLLANWLAHGVVSESEVLTSLHKMTALVDEQNREDDGVEPMSNDPESSAAWNAARELIFEGERQPGGYPEFVLHRARRAYKQSR
ncbi:malate synthase G [Nocardia sp. NPDC051030]|uniref:malate synthase G n=1 Tax=Nocardia sp. NPDC051030 TaxID=3155162 RepID=UPI00344AD796